MSCRLPLPRAVYAHGFVNDREGKKMSKSLGNVVDPNAMLAKYSADTFRFYLAYSSVFGQDVNFSEEALVTMHNAELADALGNLVHRATNLAGKYCGGAVPADAAEPAFDWWRVVADVRAAMDGYNLQEGMLAALGAVKDTNKFLTDKAPWHVKADPAKGVSEADADARRRVIVRSVLEALYLVALVLAPFIPEGAAAIFRKLSTPPRPIPAASARFDNLAPGAAVEVGDILYQKLEKEVAAVRELFPCLIRVGRIEEVGLHPSQDTLFVLQVSLGEHGRIQVCAGLRGKYEEAELAGRLVAVLLNLKAAEFKGVKSEGMLLVGDQQRPVKLQGLLNPDSSVAPGTQVPGRADRGGGGRGGRLIQDVEGDWRCCGRRCCGRQCMRRAGNEARGRGGGAGGGWGGGGGC
jgi:methionyl-tRNA synthetase